MITFLLALLYLPCDSCHKPTPITFWQVDTVVCPSCRFTDSDCEAENE
jgi:hypothetical protein